MIPDKRRGRRSIRLKGYDYTRPGGYFVTLVAFRRECLFGEVQDGEMVLNQYGKIVDDCWQAIPAHFCNVDLGAYAIMPNHLHGIILIRDASVVATGPRKGSLGAIIGAFKMAVTRRIVHDFGDANIWQRGYYERIIRDEAEANRIHAYIKANPANWCGDRENPTVGQRDTLSKTIVNEKKVDSRA